MREGRGERGEQERGDGGKRQKGITAREWTKGNKVGETPPNRSVRKRHSTDKGVFGRYWLYAAFSTA